MKNLFLLEYYQVSRISILSRVDGRTQTSKSCRKFTMSPSLSLCIPSSKRNKWNTLDISESLERLRFSGSTNRKPGWRKCLHVNTSSVTGTRPESCGVEERSDILRRAEVVCRRWTRSFTKTLVVSTFCREYFRLFYNRSTYFRHKP